LEIEMGPGHVRTPQEEERRKRWLAVVLLVVAVLVSGCLRRTQEWCPEEPVSCADSTGTACYVEPLPQGPTLFVNPLSQATEPDGTMELPYASVNEALAVAQDGDTIALAAGEYPESIEVETSVGIVGAGKERTSLESSGGGPTLALRSTASISVQGLSLSGDGGLGLLIEDCHDISIVDVKVAGYDVGEEHPGIGIQVLDSTAVTLTGVQSVDNLLVGIRASGSDIAMDGVLVQNTGPDPACVGIVITNGSYALLGLPEESESSSWQPMSPMEAVAKGGCAVVSTNGLGLLVNSSSAVVDGAYITDSAMGGIGFVEAAASEGSLSGESSATPAVFNSMVVDSGQYGVGVFGGRLEVKGTIISGVSVAAGAEGPVVAHGLNVASGMHGPARVEIADSVVEHCEGAGALLLGASSGLPAAERSILRDLTVRSTSLSGIWVQNESYADVIDCTLEDVRLVGLAYTGDSRGLAFGNQFLSIKTGLKKEFGSGEDVEMADAILLSRLEVPGSVAVQRNTVHYAERNGVLIDDTHAVALHYAGDGGGVSAFAGNVILEEATVSGDGFAFQNNCYGFDPQSVADLLQNGAAYIDPDKQLEVEPDPCIGEAALDTEWAAATELSAAE